MDHPQGVASGGEPPLAEAPKEGEVGRCGLPGTARGLLCLSEVFGFFDRSDLSLSEALQGIARAIHGGFLDPGSVGVRIVIGGRAYQAGDCRRSAPCLKEDVLRRGEKLGAVEVYLREEKPGESRYSFRPEGRLLLRLISGALGRLVSRKEMEETWRWEREQNRALAELSGALLTAGDIEEISWVVLQHAKRMTGSRYGYVGYIDMETGHLVCPTFTRDIWDACGVKDKGVVFSDFRGLWGWVLKNRQPLLSNRPAEDPRSTGVPEGHIPIERFLSVPAVMGGLLVGQVALANSDRDYGEKDLELAARLADLYAVAVMRMWTERELDRYRLQLEELVRKRTRELERSNLRLRRELEEKARREEELRNMAGQLRSLSCHLQSVREEERHRIAREVHDTLGQELTGLKIELSLLARNVGDDAELARRLSEIAGMVDSTIRSVREISAELRPSILDDLGLEAALEWQLARFEEKTGVRCRLHAGMEERLLDPEIAVTLFRVAQEALTNVARHAGAREVEVRLFREGEEIALQVRDDGRGVQEEELESASALGVLSMRERAAALGGCLSIRGDRGRGTTLEVRIPMVSPAGRDGRQGEDLSTCGSAFPERGGSGGEGDMEGNLDKGSGGR